MNKKLFLNLGNTLKKNLTFILRISIIIAMIILFYGAWSIQWQETTNSQIFWDDDRIVAGIGFIFATTGLIAWEMFLSSKKKSLYLFIITLIGTAIGTIMINGIIGLLGGGFAIVLIIISFFLDKLKQSKGEA